MPSAHREGPACIPQTGPVRYPCMQGSTANGVFRLFTMQYHATSSANRPMKADLQLVHSQVQIDDI
ncbi:hypothetical protein CGCSCA4_v009339 [Colletotrichum siamense]|uniref:Uncharacterized protein n=1 Tax=Colletotrichum siamense TaxID=690259 RepID=A0A9P5ENK5_COLSI|nr:uncharacterized protein CGCS363_v000562 [Colletotrichum siamense]KAF4841588.1 hypothetical protein CGCSCA4_v009339 [Colletotrichum siamense]KAF4855643.1 hypothetical protein CGCSCA2_v009082 [Colletotrichum siamense]KAF4872884.1 hypothetical protein CGCSCA1_v007736 [Colletotrichum siamense]KAF5517087.1 hypothetical protein CGCS363_v000562 [Colletotrichum siamense]